MVNLNYQQALDYIYSFIDYETMRQPRSVANYDLRRMEELLGRLGNPHLAAKTIHIAGTKGKGSTAAMIASALTAAGYKTGLYTSPHLFDLRERIKINGQFIAKNELTDLVARLKPEVEAVNRQALYGKLTTFELLTALGMAYFAEQKVDVQVIETGMGGRLDATNVVEPEVCVLTAIALDHTEVLGDTLAKVATEKAGIIKPKTVVISSPQQPEAATVIAETCRRVGVPLVKTGQDVTWRDMGFKNCRQQLEVKGRKGVYQLDIPLLGRCQQENAATAIAVLEVLAEKDFEITPDSIIEGLGKVSWPARFQVIGSQPTVILDGAHNPASVTELVDSLKKHFPSSEQGRAILVFGISADKDMEGIGTLLAPLFNEAIAVRSHHPRAADAPPLAGWFTEHGIKARVAATVGEAMSQAFRVVGKEDIICVTGSLFVAGEALEWLKGKGLKG